MRNPNGDSSQVDMVQHPPLSNKEYRKSLKELHVELVKLQEWVRHAGLKVCIVFEGRDGAGKGGVIKAITERVSSRVFRVLALQAPSDHLSSLFVPFQRHGKCERQQQSQQGHARVGE